MSKYPGVSILLPSLNLGPLLSHTGDFRAKGPGRFWRSSSLYEQGREGEQSIAQ